MAIAQVQATGVQSSGSVASVSKSFTSSTTTGNFLAVGVTSFNAGGAATYTVNDNKGNGNFTSARRQVVATNTACEIYYKENAAGGASHSITCTPSSSAYVSISIEEYSGVKTSAAEDVDNSGTGTSTAPSSGSATPTGTCLYIGVTTHDGATTTITPNTGGGWTQSYEAEDATNMPINSQYRVSSGAQTASWTLAASRTWGAVMATFQEAAAGTRQNPVWVPCVTNKLIGMGTGMGGL